MKQLGFAPRPLPPFPSPGICKVWFCVWPGSSRSSLWSLARGGRGRPFCTVAPTPQPSALGGELASSFSGAEEKDCITHIFLKTPSGEARAGSLVLLPISSRPPLGPSLTGEALVGKVPLPDRKLERADQRKTSFPSVEHSVLGSGIPDAQIGSDPCNSLHGPIFSRIMAASHCLPAQSERIVEGEEPREPPAVCGGLPATPSWLRVGGLPGNKEIKG